MNYKRSTLAASLVIASSLTLTACELSNRDAYTDNVQLSNTTKGVVVGALAAGATAGALGANGYTAGGIAAGGAVVGGIVGYQMDKQNDALRVRMRSIGVKVLEDVNDGSNDVTLVLPSDVHFRPASAALDQHFMQVLDAVALEMKEFKYSVAEIPGNTDSVGSPRANLRLSWRRANAVADYLASRGIPRDRLVPKGYGEAYPVASNRTGFGRMLNRRVCVILHQPPINT
jgi:outer membrane protein OmpA-like peptidoglycan-associated protein